MKKQCKIHLIATDKKSRLYIHNVLGLKINPIDDDSWIRKDEQGYNFYITDDSPIKEGDWYIDITTSHWKGVGALQMVGYTDGRDTKNIIQSNAGTTTPKINARKIIATTDNGLGRIHAPSISQQDIETIVKLYNDGGNWEDVKVEYNIDEVNELSSGNTPSLAQPKLSPKGNVVLSFEKKLPHCYCDKDPFECECIKMYSREEVEENIYSFLATKLGLTEMIGGVPNTWEDNRGNRFMLTKYGFKKI
jgi:hypothetical protein